MDFAEARSRMVDSQVRPNKVTDPRIIAAMRRLPRERFLPPDRAVLAYTDEDVPLGEGRVLIEPMVMARMLQLTAVLAGERVLVVGCGIGYGAGCARRSVAPGSPALGGGGAAARHRARGAGGVRAFRKSCIWPVGQRVAAGCAVRRDPDRGGGAFDPADNRCTASSGDRAAGCRVHRWPWHGAGGARRGDGRRAADAADVRLCHAHHTQPAAGARVRLLIALALGVGLPAVAHQLLTPGRRGEQQP